MIPTHTSIALNSSLFVISDNTGEFNATEIWSKPLNIYACYCQLFSAIVTRQTIFSYWILQLCVPRCFHLYILAFHIICTFSSVAFACYTIWKTDSNRFVTLAFTTDFFNCTLDMFFNKFVTGTLFSML
jgi:hypothetical protein